eukprot:7383495-Prymnesium_polylepis.1
MCIRDSNTERPAAVSNAVRAVFVPQTTSACCCACNRHCTRKNVLSARAASRGGAPVDNVKEDCACGLHETGVRVSCCAQLGASALLVAMC